mmetsp:Transcript_9463/g.21646  ORF Transcript_9463/g.21646 Transcript_9463/m.21646 type:complete len:219 (-) Transcript_9463:338-994(-)
MHRGALHAVRQRHAAQGRPCVSQPRRRLPAHPGGPAASPPHAAPRAPRARVHAGYPSGPHPRAVGRAPRRRGAPPRPRLRRKIRRLLLRLHHRPVLPPRHHPAPGQLHAGQPRPPRLLRVLGHRRLRRAHGRARQARALHAAQGPDPGPAGAGPARHRRALPPPLPRQARDWGPARRCPAGARRGEEHRARRPHGQREPDTAGPAGTRAADLNAAAAK